MRTAVRPLAGLLIICFYALYLLFSQFVGIGKHRADPTLESAVLPPPLQVFLYLGDRYLAANVELTRVLMTGGELTGVQQDVYHRLHSAVATFNPCHEDNFYIANALLAWAGGADLAIDILREATNCRFWDELPPFLLGFDLYYFKNENARAREMLFIAAERSTDNNVGYRKFGIMMEAEAQPDLEAALRYLMAERASTRDSKLRDLLGKRIVRLEGLVALRKAQVEFELRYRRKLEDPADIFAAGILKDVPVDPLGLGYQFADGRFSLRELTIGGMSEREKWMR